MILVALAQISLELGTEVKEAVFFPSILSPENSLLKEC